LKQNRISSFLKQKLENGELYLLLPRDVPDILGMPIHQSRPVIAEPELVRLLKPE
jgi:hypothetical protein